MNIAFAELWRIGLIEALVRPDSPLCYVGWAVVAAGGLIQWLLLKRAKRPAIRWGFAVVLALGLLAGEIGFQSITGWDQLLPIFGCWLALLALAGCGLAVLFRGAKNHH